MCLKVIDAPVLELEADDGEVEWLDNAPTLWSPQAPSESKMEWSRDLGTTTTVVGEIKADTSSPADAYLGTTSAGMLTNVDSIEEVDGVTGLGIVTKF